MSRTRWCIVTATILAVSAVMIAVVPCCVLGGEIPHARRAGYGDPARPGRRSGRSADDASSAGQRPPACAARRILEPAVRRPRSGYHAHPEQRSVAWTQLAWKDRRAVPAPQRIPGDRGPHHPGGLRGHGPYAPAAAGEYLELDGLTDADKQKLSDHARQTTLGHRNARRRDRGPLTPLCRWPNPHGTLGGRPSHQSGGVPARRGPATTAPRRAAGRSDGACRWHPRPGW